MKKTIFDLLFEQAANAESDQTPEGEVNIQGDRTVKARKSNESVDDQIDALILMYESKSIIDDAGDINESFMRNSLKTFLFEQEESDAGAGADAGESAESPGMTSSDEPSGSENVSVEGGAEKDMVPDLDVDMFTKRIARLIMNYRNLLRIEDVILNRGKNYLDENYGNAFVEKYLDSLESQFGIKVSEFEEEDIQDAPFAIGANPAGAGSVGGS